MIMEWGGIPYADQMTIERTTGSPDQGSLVHTVHLPVASPAQVADDDARVSSARSLSAAAT